MDMTATGEMVVTVKFDGNVGKVLELLTFLSNSGNVESICASAPSIKKALAKKTTGTLPKQQMQTADTPE